MGCCMSEPEKEAPAPAAASKEEAPKLALPTFTFASGLPDCCKANPEYYTVLAECPNARLVQMKVPPGGQDAPHDHPGHSMFFVKAAKLSIQPFDETGKPAGDANVVEIPEGAPPIFPPGAHQVKNLGDSDAHVIFVEPLPTCKPCGEPEGFVSPFTVSPKCYTVLAENDEWTTGMMEMGVGEGDLLHNHRDHLIYVLAGDEVTIYPGGDESDPHAIPIKPGAGIAAPVAAGPIFNKHKLKNSGTVPVKMLFFEMKQ